MAKDVGARKVIFASCAPPIRYASLLARPPSSLDGPFLRYSNVYGIDMPSRNELVAYHRESDQIAKVLGADLVIYQTLPDLIRSVQQFNPALTAFDCSVFTGEYVTGDIDEKYLAWVEENRAEKAMLGSTVQEVLMRQRRMV
jgi:amidophosphoribosyltransferase